MRNLYLPETEQMQFLLGQERSCTYWLAEYVAPFHSKRNSSTTDIEQREWERERE